jgi:hypothetical protein
MSHDISNLKSISSIHHVTKRERTKGRKTHAPLITMLLRERIIMLKRWSKRITMTKGCHVSKRITMPKGCYAAKRFTMPKGHAKRINMHVGVMLIRESPCKNDAPRASPYTWVP